MLTDGVITLRHPTMDDVDAICAGCQDPEVPKWTGVPSPYTRENAVEWIERTVEERDAKRTQAFIAELDGEFAASCSLMELDKRPGYGEIGYWVAAPCPAQGRREPGGAAAEGVRRQRARADADRAARPRGQRAVTEDRGARRVHGDR